MIFSKSDILLNQKNQKYVFQKCGEAYAICFFFQPNAGSRFGQGKTSSRLQTLFAQMQPHLFPAGFSGFLVFLNLQGHLMCAWHSLIPCVRRKVIQVMIIFSWIICSNDLFDDLEANHLMQTNVVRMSQMHCEMDPNLEEGIRDIQPTRCPSNLGNDPWRDHWEHTFLLEYRYVIHLWTGLYEWPLVDLHRALRDILGPFQFKHPFDS